MFKAYYVQWKNYVGLFFVSSILLSANVSAEVAMVEDGESRAVIVLPAEPEAKERLAADELVEHIQLMTGAVLDVVREGEAPDELLPIYLGAAADADLDDLTLEKGNNLSSFTLRVAEDRIDVRGIDYRHATLEPAVRDRGEGTLFGVYELLEQLGFRWYIPGDLGRVVPEGDSAMLDIQVETQAPSMDLRLLQPWQIAREGWIARQRLGGERRSTGRHGIPPFSNRRTARPIFENNPEYFALIDGERRLRQICPSNPEVLQLVVELIRKNHDPTSERFYIGMGPNDGTHYCECEDCRALDGDVYDPFYDTISVTGRYIWFFNQLLDALEDDYPNLHIVWYVYAMHMMPPPENLQPNPRIVNVFGPITQCRIRSMDNPMSPDRHMLRWLIDEWSDTNPNEMYYAGYYNFLACVQLPKTQIDRVRVEIPAIHERGINVMRVECIRTSWVNDPLTLYLAARLMWDVDTDVDAVLDEFYRKYYGPAREPMRRYHEGLEAAFRDTPYFTGASYPYFPIFKTHPRRDELRGYLEEAKEVIQDRNSIYAERLWAIRRGYERMELFLDMMKARNRHDFETAHARMEDFDRLTEELVDYELEDIGLHREWGMRMINLNESKERGRASYFNRLYRSPIESGHERVVEMGEIVATLPDEWGFLLDTAEIGEIAGYYRPGELGGNWQPMKTKSRSWSDQGHHYYQGWSWYRSRVEIPEAFEDRPIYLWVGAVDTWASVWINGEYMGTSREPKHGLPGIPGTFLPFDMPTRDLDGESVLNFGGENWVVIKVVRDRLNELGTGGVMAPVMFWSPCDPDWMPED